MRNIKCDKEYQTKQKEKRFIKKRDKYFKKVNEKYNFNFDYSESKYVDGETIIIIKCKKHNYSFNTKPRLHLHRGSGCKFCSTENRKKSKLKNTESFIEKSIKVHGSKYDYSETQYTHSDNYIQIKCIEHNNLFSQMARSHLQGNMGCEKCSNRARGFNVNKPAILYYLSIYNGQAYKIGITNSTVEQRYTSNDLAKITIINTIQYHNGLDALRSEQKIIKENQEYKYIGKNLLKSGNTELFNKDILGLDNGF